jgi:hypothetical protein
MKRLRPPASARLILWLFAPERDGEAIAGDLFEEFATIAAGSSEARASVWYVRQVLYSISPFCRMKVRSGEFVLAALLGVISSSVPLFFADSLRSYVLSQIPMKEDSVRSSTFLLSMEGLAFLSAIGCGVLLGRVCRVTQRTTCLLMVLAAMLATGVWAVGGFGDPAWYGALLLLSGPVGVCLGTCISYGLGRQQHHQQQGSKDQSQTGEFV